MECCRGGVEGREIALGIWWISAEGGRGPIWSSVWRGTTQQPMTPPALSTYTYTTAVSSPPYCYSLVTQLHKQYHSNFNAYLTSSRFPDILLWAESSSDTPEFLFT